MLKNKKLIFAIAVFILVSGLLIYIYKSSTKSKPTLRETISEVLHSCSRSKINYYSCFRKAISPVVKNNGLNPVIISLDQIFGSETARLQGFSCHDLSHIVGEVAINSGDDLEKTLINCTKTCQYGCAHGALIAGIVKNPELLNNLSDVCMPFINSSPQDLDACNHGIGHGVSEYTDMNLFKSLDICNKVIPQTAKEKCAQGVFMQITDYVDTPYFKITRSISDFCNSVPKDLRGSCFDTASSHEYGRSKDVQKSLLVCSQIPSKYRSECVVSLVNLLYSNYEGSGQKILDYCNNVNVRDYDACIKGAIEPDVIADPKAAMSIFLCTNSVNEYKNRCFEVLGQRYEYVYGKEKRVEFCSNFPNNLDKTCLTNEN